MNKWCQEGNHPNCKWMLEPSSTRYGVYYIKASDQRTYICAHTSTEDGRRLTMHAEYYNQPNCQWRLEPSPTRSGMYYIKAGDRDTYIHAFGGTADGAELTMHPCPKGGDYPNCQWLLDVPAA